MTQKTYERTKDAVLHALKSMSASDIARLCDVDPGKVSRWKSGDLNAKYNRIKPLLEKIGPLPTEGNRRLFRVVPDPLTISPDLLDSIQPESFSSKDWLLNALARELEDIRGVGEGEYWKFEHELYRYIPEEPKQDSMDKKEEKAKLIQEMLRQKATRLEEVFLKVQQAESDEDIEIDFGVFSEWVVEKFYGQAAGFAHARQTAWEFLSQFSGQEISLPKLLTQHSVALAKKAKVREYQWAEELRENLATEGCMLEMIDQIAQYNAMVYELFKQARQEVQVTGDVVFQKRWDEKKGQFSLDRPFYDRINFKTYEIKVIELIDGHLAVVENFLPCQLEEEDEVEVLAREITTLKGPVTVEGLYKYLNTRFDAINLRERDTLLFLIRKTLVESGRELEVGTRI